MNEIFGPDGDMLGVVLDGSQVGVFKEDDKVGVVQVRVYGELRACMSLH